MILNCFPHLNRPKPRNTTKKLSTDTAVPSQALPPAACHARRDHRRSEPSHPPPPPPSHTAEAPEPESPDSPAGYPSPNPSLSGLSRPSTADHHPADSAAKTPPAPRASPREYIPS